MIILVTGGCGFIGSELVLHAQSLNAEIRVLDDKSYAGCQSRLKDVPHTFIQGSITDRELVRQAMQDVDYVFHMAALISVSDSYRIPAEYEHVNTVGTLILLEEATRAGVKGFVFSSSSAVYGNSLPIRKSENSEPRPLSPYAWSKLHAEHYCTWFQQQTSMNISILRYFNVFGTHQDPKRPYAACVATFLHRALHHQPLTIYGDGTQTRDFVHVSDVVLFNLYAALEGLQGVFNVGTGKEVSIQHVADTITQKVRKVPIHYDSARLGDVQRIYSNPYKVGQTSFRYQYTFETGLDQVLDDLNVS